jgi:hypothetical protein
MDEPNIRSALAEHLEAYGEVVSSSSRQWAAELKRRVVIFIVAAFFTLLTVVVGIFVAILASWNTPWRWWVAGGILALCIVGVLFGVIAAGRAVRTRSTPPWMVLADEIANDLRGGMDEPSPINDAAAALRLQNSREQLHGMFARRAAASGEGAAGGGAKVGLGIAGLLLMALLKRKARTMGGMGLALSLALTALRAWRGRS